MRSGRRVSFERSEALLHVDLETLEGPLREVVEWFRQQEAVVFLENGVPVGTLMFLSASPPGPTGNGGEPLTGEERP
jgi:hypothetical protein